VQKNTLVRRPRGPRKDSGRSTRERLLDAAERAFAAQGFHAVSIRDITRAAGVDVALVNYYFGGKQALFEEVFLRRAELLNVERLRRLETVVSKAAPDPPSIEAIIDAFTHPLLDRSARGGPGWKAYFALIAQVNNSKEFGGLIMTHSDDNGLIAPPRLAPVQVAIVPIWKSEDEKAQVSSVATQLKGDLEKAGLRVELDLRDTMKPGAKYYEWEALGVPVRLDIGPREAAKGGSQWLYTLLFLTLIGGIAYYLFSGVEKSYDNVKGIEANRPGAQIKPQTRSEFQEQQKQNYVTAVKNSQGLAESQKHTEETQKLMQTVQK